MGYVELVGQGIIVPTLFYGPLSETQIRTATDTSTMDADEEEVQWIGQVNINGGGSKTFGGGSSAIEWLPGASITFADDGANDPTLRVGVKKASSISTSAGPPAQATAGAAAFDVYTDLTGGTDTITNLTWRSDAQGSGTPFTVANGDLIAICWHLNKPGAGAQSVKVRASTIGAPMGLPVAVLYTGTYTAQLASPNCVLVFSDGTLGWLSGATVFSATDVSTATIGNTNIYANIFTLPFPCKIDAIGYQGLGTAGADHAVEIYTTPLGTPVSAVSVTIDNNQQGATASRLRWISLVTPYEIQANTAYAVGIRQTTATAMTINQMDVETATHLRQNGLSESSCYAATSTAGATFAAANSGKRRYSIWIRVSHLSDGAGVGSRPLLTGGRM